MLACKDRSRYSRQGLFLAWLKGAAGYLLERLLREDVDLLGLHGLPLAEVHLAAPRVGPSLKTSLQTFRMHVLLINFNLN